MKHIFIVNENAGVEKERVKCVQAIRNICTTAEYDFEIYFTKTKEEAHDIAEEVSFTDPDAIIYSVGGDGTLNNIVNAISVYRTTIGIIPVGTGNDAYKSFVGQNFDVDIHLPRLLSVNKSEVTKHDLINVNKTIATNCVSTGLDAVACDNIKYFRKVPLLSSGMKYTLGAALAIGANKNQTLTTRDTRITSEKARSVLKSSKLITREMCLIAVFNGEYYGSKYHMSPYSNTQDRRLNVVEASPMNRLEIIKLFGGINDGKHLYHDCVDTFEVIDYSIESEEPMVCNIDGEISRTNKMNISLHPAELKLRRPI